MVWPTSSVALVSDGLLTGWTGTLPNGWFTYNGYEGLRQMPDFIKDTQLPIIGDHATVFWFGDIDSLNKKEIVDKVFDLCRSVIRIKPEMTIWFVTHVPLMGSRKLKVVKFKNSPIKG